MQRILRDTQAMLGGTFESYKSKIALIHRHFPPSIGNIYAIPRNGKDDTLEWWTELPGQPIRFDDLRDKEKTALLSCYEQRQQSLGRLADELERRGDADAAESLKTLMGSADTQHLYSINGEPVVIRWGGGMEEVKTSIVTPPPPKTPTVAPPAAAPSRRRLFWLLLWILPLILLLILGWLLFLLWPLDRYWPSWFGSPSSTVAVPYACREEGKDLPPEFVVIFDTSGSMNLNILATLEDEIWYFGMSEFQQMLLRNMGNERLLALESGSSRLDVAKDAVSRIVSQLHPDIDMGLITYAGCGHPVQQGVFSVEQRDQLIAGIQTLHAGDGTPLAESLVAASELVDGQGRDAVILAFVDGTDGCEQDQCQVAAEIARNQPRLTINVVDVSSGGLSNCLAEQTGGTVFTSQDSGEVAQMLKDASYQLLDESYCQ